ncbi:MAG: MarR family transcriptional regulator [Myxococcales bacterium]
MSRQDLHEFLVHRLKLQNITPEREELIASVMTEGRRMGTRTVVFHAAIADRLGLNPSDHKCADLICNETGPITAGRLAEITGLSTGAITGVVDRLERAGFVARVPDPEDRRRVVIKGTENRAPDMRHMFLPMMENMAALCDKYTNEQLALIAGFMKGMGGITEAQIEHMQRAKAAPPPAAAPTLEAPENAGVSGSLSAAGRKR